ncbi:hypothetical protein DV738_g3433, partial [Chaetothyriales sp. CBS 135597]
MSEYLPAFIVDPVLRQARRLSRISGADESPGFLPPVPDLQRWNPSRLWNINSYPPSSAEEGEEAGKESTVLTLSESSVSTGRFGALQSQRVHQPSLEDVWTASETSFLANRIRGHSQSNHPSDSDMNMISSRNLDGAVFSSARPAAPGTLPEDDGMGDLRQRINAIWSGTATPAEKSEQIHALMMERYHICQNRSRAQTSGREEVPRRTGSAMSVRSATSQDAVFSLSKADLTPTYAPLDEQVEDNTDSNQPHQPQKPELGCVHYQRKVKIQCAICERWYTCRLCHDKVEDHTLPRRETKFMLCMVCKTPQRAAQTCEACNELAAYYYCDICKLWSDDPEKKVYHCDDCGICRLGEGLGKDFFHCQKCSACMSISAEDTHKCIERSTKCDCPICGEYLFTSSEPVAFMLCGHSIHDSCYTAWRRISYKCPICSKSIANMESQFRRLDREIEEQPMPEEYHSTRALVFCNDCNGRSIGAFHWLALKCSLCESYNTVQLELLGPQQTIQEEQLRQSGMGEAGVTASQTSMLTEELSRRAVMAESDDASTRPTSPPARSTRSPWLMMPSPTSRSVRSMSPVVGSYFGTGQTQVRPSEQQSSSRGTAILDDGTNLDFWGRRSHRSAYSHSAAALLSNAKPTKHRLKRAMEHDEIARIHRQEVSSSGSDEDHSRNGSYLYASTEYTESEPLTYTPASTVYSPSASRPNAPARTPSNAYAPARKPPHIPLLNSNKRLHSSQNVWSSRRDPNAQYKAQEKAYVQRVRQQPQDWPGNGLRTPSWGYSTDEDDDDIHKNTDDEAPLADHTQHDPYDPETLMFLGDQDNLQPTEEELAQPDTRERLEWHSMLASVLKGDVVRQEKQRLIGTAEQKTRTEITAEIWLGVRAKYYGRPIPMQKKLIEEARGKVGTLIDSIIGFEIKGETVVGKSPLEQVEEAVAQIEQAEWLFASRRQLQLEQPKAGSQAFADSCNAVVSWFNITQIINTELAVLQAWVGNADLDFSKPKPKSDRDGRLSDDSSFIDRILKEDGLKSLQGKNSMFNAIGEVISKAKATLTENAAAFAARHLPPYIEELLTLINFPSRLICEIIKMRLTYAKKMKESAQQSVMIIDQMISQFQILMELACLTKQQYLLISQPEPGWDLPPCLDEDFDSTILGALKFYFKMLNWKLGANKNTFREAEILEQEWGFSNEIGRQLQGGDIEVAEQFSSLTAKSLLRLTASFERDFRYKTDETPQEMEKRYKTILDSVRVRQRKLFRFSRLLRQRFENATEFNLAMNASQLQEFSQSLVLSGHFMVEMGVHSPKGVYFIASPSLWGREKEIASILGTSFQAEDGPEEQSFPYILALRPEEALVWEGPKIQMEVVELPGDVRLGRLRLIADGSAQRLQAARAEFTNAVGRTFDVVIEQRANLQRVNLELGKIKKTAFKLSNTIMESVEAVRSGGAASHELIQSCFAFATEFGKRSLTYMDPNRRMMNNLKLTRLALDWISFICDDCDAADRRTFKWAVVALEFAMAMTRGRNILDITEEEYTRIRTKVAGCMAVLISHFDIMGARSTLAAQQEKSRMDAAGINKRLDFAKMRNDDDCLKQRSAQRMQQLQELDDARADRGPATANLGRVLEGQDEADRSLTFLSSSATNVNMRWQQGRYVGGGTFGSVYAALNLDTGTLMAVKEIRLQDPQMVPTIVKQISDEMGVLAVLDHPNIVSYYGIEVHRDKVYIFMEYCSGNSMAGLLEHGRFEDETVIQGQTIITAPDPSMDKSQPGIPQKPMIGTPMYMSPEVIRGEAPAQSKYAGAADIWSLGCVILEMATGRRPWASLDNEWAIMYNIAQGNPPQLPTPEQLSEPGIDFLRKCFERDPAKRATAPELLQHPWILEIRRMVVDDPEVQTPRSESATSTGSTPIL